MTPHVTTTTGTPHVIGMNPAFVSEDVYEEIREEDGKLVVGDASYMKICNTYEPLVLAVGGKRPVSIYPSDSNTPGVDSLVAQGYDNETGVEHYRDSVPTREETGIGNYNSTISNNNTTFDDYLHPI